MDSRRHTQCASHLDRLYYTVCGALPQDADWNPMREVLPKIGGWAASELAAEAAPGWPFRLLPLRALYARFSLRSRVSPAGREAYLRRLSPGERESA